MPRLLELQKIMSNSLLGGDLAMAEHLIAPGDFGPLTGLETYRNNVLAGFANALALEFPVIERLVGVQYFRQLAQRFQRRYPSRSGNLQAIGAQFADFLQSEYAGSGYAYLADVAQLEWACETVSHVATDTRANLAQFESCDVTDFSTLRLRRRRDSLLLASIYPIVTIWSSNLPGQSIVDDIDLSSGGEFAAVIHNRQVEVVTLTAGSFALLQSLESHMTLAEALDAALQAQADFDLESELAKLFRHHFFAETIV
jgi:hypothetical protein